MRTDGLSVWPDRLNDPPGPLARIAATRLRNGKVVVCASLATTPGDTVRSEKSMSLPEIPSMMVVSIVGGLRLLEAVWFTSRMASFSPIPPRSMVPSLSGLSSFSRYPSGTGSRGST